MLINLPKDVIKIIDDLESKGHEAYIVGGCVRDSIMGVVPKDWDITTSALPDQVVQIFPKTFASGIKHGTVTVVINQIGYEVTTYRIDGEYLDNRRPDNVVFTSDINKDLSRRDFTINAIAYNPKKGFVDPFFGKEDIENKLIRCVGNPNHRFSEDALRMLRAIRFSGQLNFAIDNETINVISALSRSICNISAERIRDELVKLIISTNVEAIKMLKTTGLLLYIIPSYIGDLDKVISLLKSCPFHECMRLAVFFEYSRDKCNHLLRHLRFDNKTIKEVHYYISMINTIISADRYEIKKYLRYVSLDIFTNLLTLQSLFYPDNASNQRSVYAIAHDIIQKEECFCLTDLSVKGVDLIAAGIPNGKPLGDKLEELLDMVMRKPELNDCLHKFL